MLLWAHNSPLRITTGCHKMADVADLHQDPREQAVRQHNELIFQQLVLACKLPQHPCHQLCHRPPDDVLWSAGLNLTSSNTSPKSHSTTPATSRPLSASNKMRSELPLKAAHHNYLMAGRRLLMQQNIHCQGRRELYWNSCAPVTAEFFESMQRKSSRQRSTIATTVVIRLMTPTTSSTVLRSRPHWQ